MGGSGGKSTQSPPANKMKLALTMPQFGESITEALIVRWLKKAGDEVAEREPLIEMETEKSVFSYESPFKGKMVKVLAGENQQVRVGTEIAYFEVEEAAAKKYLALGIGTAIDSGAHARLPGGQVAPAAKAIPPLIRSLAKEHGVPVEEVEKLPGSGPEGRLTKEDFLRYLEKRQGPVAPREGLPSGDQGVKEIPLTPVRARIAEKMALSKRTIPHAGTGVDADVTAIAEWRERNGSKYGFLPFVLCSVIPALRKFPVLNSSFREKEGRQWIEEHPSVHLGIATATPQGLMVPVLKNAGQASFLQIVARGTELIEKARSGRLGVSELTGGTFTVNNTGALGAIRSQQVIPPPQSGILAVNRVVQRPWVVGGQIAVRSILSLDLAFDHRLVDGDAACGFLEEIRKSLENFDFSLIG